MIIIWKLVKIKVLSIVPSISFSISSFKCIFVKITAKLALSQGPSKASTYLTDSSVKNRRMVFTRRFQINNTKFSHITFTLKKNSSSPSNLLNTPLQQSNVVQDFGLHLDSKLTRK